jgi:phosphoribosylamine--glycine ligase
VAAQSIDLTLVGPEVPLDLGIVDDFQAHGLKIWGPSRAAAQLEASKAFCKDFLARHHIPTGGYATFTDFESARAYLLAQTEPIVIKASGLAAGKGVILPDTPAEAEAALREMMVNREFGAAGNEVLIEERLTGPEVSVFAFCGWPHAVLCPPPRTQNGLQQRRGAKHRRHGGLLARADLPAGDAGRNRADGHFAHPGRDGGRGCAVCGRALRRDDADPHRPQSAGI